MEVGFEPRRSGFKVSFPSLYCAMRLHRTLEHTFFHLLYYDATRVSRQLYERLNNVSLKRTGFYADHLESES